MDADGSLPPGRISVPEDVVRRAFGEETVLLNLTTGQYHGLNAVAGRMLDLLEEHGDAERAARTLTAEYDVTLETVTADLAGICAQLRDRGLITIEG